MINAKKKDNTKEKFYRPSKNMPEIIKMASKEKGAYPNISAIKPFEDMLQIYYMPEARVIGKEVIVPQNDNIVPAFWDEVISSGDLDIIKSLPSIIEGATYGWTCDWVEETKSFSYLVSAICPKDTPVHEGFQYRNIPETLVAKDCLVKTYQRPASEWQSLGMLPIMREKDADGIPSYT